VEAAPVQSVRTVIAPSVNRGPRNQPKRKGRK
jgi:hypothetical protein